MAFLDFLLVLLFIGYQLFLSAFFLPLPVSDMGTVRYRTLPYMTILLILVNSLVFIVWQASNLYQGFDALDLSGSTFLLDQYVKQLWTFGYRTSYLREGLSIGAFTTFTSMFMHADIWHLLGNMIFLWAFGRRLEDACGPWRFLLFYLFAGMVANLGSALLNPLDPGLLGFGQRPGVGASGAISGVMGAYLLLFPGAQLFCLWGIMSIIRIFVVYLAKLFGFGGELRTAPVWRWTIKVPAWLLLIYFLIRDLLPSLETIQNGENFSGVNNLAHLTGFLAALAIVFFVRKDLAARFFSGRAV
jgi:membrane associated rhomboid family serine protease